MPTVSEKTPLNPSLQHQGTLFGSHLFDYLAKEPSEPDNPAKECHILISLNNTQSPTLKLATDAYDWLLQLLCCYHKLRYIYHQSRQRYPEARHLELWIAVVGTGLAVSGISSQVDSQPIQTFIQNQTNSDTPICPGAGVVKCTAYNGLNVLIHIIIAVAIALPIGLIIRQIRHPSK